MVAHIPQASLLLLAPTAAAVQQAWKLSVFLPACPTSPSCARAWLQGLGHWFCRQNLQLFSGIASGSNCWMTGRGLNLGSNLKLNYAPNLRMVHINVKLIQCQTLMFFVPFLASFNETIYSHSPWHDPWMKSRYHQWSYLFSFPPLHSLMKPLIVSFGIVRWNHQKCLLPSMFPVQWICLLCSSDLFCWDSRGHCQI